MENIEIHGNNIKVLKNNEWLKIIIEDGSMSIDLTEIEGIFTENINGTYKIILIGKSSFKYEIKDINDKKQFNKLMQYILP